MPDFVVGSLVDCVVTRLEQYGAWVVCEGREGLIVIPEISWSRISHPRDHLTVGQSVRVKILVAWGESFSASIRAVHPEHDPWYEPARFAVGNAFEAPVVRVLEYGCFVELKPDVWALLHREKWPRPISEGEILHVRVENTDAAARKIEVSLLQQ